MRVLKPSTSERETRARLGASELRVRGNAAKRPLLYSERGADNSRVCCARGFAAPHLVYCSYCEQRSRRFASSAAKLSTSRLQLPVLKAAGMRLTGEDAKLTARATGSVSLSLDSDDAWS